MFGILMFIVAIYGFALAVRNRSARRFTKWFTGILGVVIALSVLLIVTSPAANNGWFTPQQGFGLLAIAIAIGAFGLVYFVFGVVGVIWLVARQFSSRPAAAPRLMHSVDGTLRPL